MTNKTSVPAKFLKLIDKRGFIIPVHHGDKKQYEYGTMGTLLRENVKEQWWKGINKQTHSSVYRVECPPLPPTTNNRIARNTENRESLNKDCLNHLKPVLDLTNRQLPFSLATAGHCVQSHLHKLEPEERILNGGNIHTQLLLQNFVPPIDTGKTMDLWLQLRLSWWKHYAKHPAMFTVDPQTKSDKKETASDSENMMSIYFEFPWGKQSVETIHNTRDTYLWQLTKLDGGDYMSKAPGNRDVMPYVIECSTVLEKATLAWLFDAYHDRESVLEGKNRNVLHLHPKLAPYQVAVIRETSEDTSYTLKISTLCSHVVKLLKEKDLSVLHASETGNTIPQHINRCDELGIPYTLILDETTFKTGILKLRHRDTEVMMEGHITTVPDQIAHDIKAELHSKPMLREDSEETLENSLP